MKPARGGTERRNADDSTNADRANVAIVAKGGERMQLHSRTLHTSDSYNKISGGKWKEARRMCD